MKPGPLSAIPAKLEMCQFHAGKFQLSSPNRNFLNIYFKIRLIIRYLDLIFILLVFTLSRMAKMFSSQKWTEMKPQRLPLLCLMENHPDRYWNSGYNCCPAVLMGLQQDCSTGCRDRLLHFAAFCCSWFCWEFPDPLSRHTGRTQSTDGSSLDSEQGYPDYRTKIPPKVRETLFRSVTIYAAVPTQVNDCRKEAGV